METHIRMIPGRCCLRFALEASQSFGVFGDFGRLGPASQVLTRPAVVALQSDHF
jgi:hypothetical protein